MWDEQTDNLIKQFNINSPIERCDLIYTVIATLLQ